MQISTTYNNKNMFSRKVKTADVSVVKGKRENSKFAKKLKEAFTYNTRERKRIWELDILRGILMLFVTLDHCCTFGLSLGIFNFRTVFGQALREWIIVYRESAFRVGIQPFGLFLFCYLSGINCSLTKSRFKRVAKMITVCGLFMGTVALLHVLVPDFIHEYLMFNIIAVITICVTVWWFFDLIKCPTWVRLMISIIIICVGLTYYYMYFSRDFSYINNDFLALLVYNSHGFKMSPNNFEPLFPHLGWFILGGIMGKYIYKNKQTLTKNEEPYKVFRPIAYVGKHSLVVYIVGTIVVLALVLAIREFVGLFI